MPLADPKDRVGRHLPSAALKAMYTYAEKFDWNNLISLDVLMETYHSKEMRNFEKGIVN